MVNDTSRREGRPLIALGPGQFARNLQKGRRPLSAYEAPTAVRTNIEDVGHQRRSCARACRQQCTPPVLFEHITMDHVGETRLMISGWDVPRTQPVVPSRRLQRSTLLSRTPLSNATRYDSTPTIRRRSTVPLGR
ncbi:unnamed protein product [Lasius platythorax]|uniref:Uncharacterized protein n=1 Tax=Lasius platythorax TaxID=488582 RepID=A0AAV2N6U8_9HYME